MKPAGRGAGLGAEAAGKPPSRGKKAAGPDARMQRLEAPLRRPRPGKARDEAPGPPQGKRTERREQAPRGHAAAEPREAGTTRTKRSRCQRKRAGRAACLVTERAAGGMRRRRSLREASRARGAGTGSRGRQAGAGGGRACGSVQGSGGAARGPGRTLEESRALPAGGDPRGAATVRQPEAPPPDRPSVPARRAARGAPCWKSPPRPGLVSEDHPVRPLLPRSRQPRNWLAALRGCPPRLPVSVRGPSRAARTPEIRRPAGPAQPQRHCRTGLPCRRRQQMLRHPASDGRDP